MSIPAQGAVGAETMTAGQSLDLRDLHAANIARQAEWCPDQVPDLSFRGNELGGECGEAQNVIKKLERERQGWRGSRATKDDLADELADVVICADLCAVTADIDLGAAVRRKFNATSEKQGLSVFLPPPALASPRADSDERTAGEDLNDRLRAAGMFTIPEMMGETPLTRWEVHAAMKSLDAFGWWLEAQVRQYLTMKAEYDLSGRPEGDELYEWVLAHAAAFRTIRVNFEAARKATPAQPAGAAPDSLRALIGEAGRWDCPKSGSPGLPDDHEVPVPLGSLRALDKFLASHPAGQSAGSGAWAEHSPQEIVRRTRCMADETRDPVVWRDCCDLILDRLGKPAPDSTRTGQGEAIARAAYVRICRHDSKEGWQHAGADFDRREEDGGCYVNALELALAIGSDAAEALAARPAAPEAQGVWSFDMEAAPRDGSDVEIVNDRGQFIARFDRSWGRSYADAGWWMVSDGKDPERPLRGDEPFAWRIPTKAPAPPSSSGQGGR